jgi:hypothetical protein
MEMHKTALRMLKLDWVQEKLEKRWEEVENRNWESFTI